MKDDATRGARAPASGRRGRSSPHTAGPGTKRTTEALVDAHGERRRDDIARGVAACAAVWDFGTDGAEAFHDFCLAQYEPPGRRRRALLERLDEVHGSVFGTIGMSLKILAAGSHIADRPDLPAERVFGAFHPGTHLSEDYRRAKIAALAQLNFGTDETAAPRSRPAWAARRAAVIGRTFVPAEHLQARSHAKAEVDRFVASYNLHLENIRFEDPSVRFPEGTKLIAHWGLRDYMTSLNGSPDALPKQRAILDLLRRVTDGEIPAEMLDDAKTVWDLPAGRLRTGGRSRPAEGHGALRWEKFRTAWHAQRAIDPYRYRGNLIDETFLESREMPERDVVGVLTDVLSSPVAERVARFVRDRLGRDLLPCDVYYSDFAGDGPEKKPLRYDIRKRYPTAGALGAAIPDVLVKLGWKRPRAKWIASKIRVDNARSAGHAWAPYGREDLQLLRVRVDPRGCDEFAFDTFMHELGHAVEGVLSSFEMDYRLLWSVPNTAFTEGFAFTFQDRTDHVLGRRETIDRDVETLERLWEPFEIAGPALTEIRFFHWLYEHPDASAEEMMHAVRRIGDEVWREFYARIFGGESYGLMSVYSHMLSCNLYLADYPMGFVIAYQIRKHLRERSLAEEMERMCALGSIYPQSWMRAAVGRDVSVKPLLQDTARALDRLGY